MPTPSPHPWRELSPDIVAVIQPGIPQVSEEIVEAIREAVPAYRRPLEGAFGRGLRRGVEQGIGGFIGLVESRSDAVPGVEIAARLGAGEAREGRPLDALLSAYRVGARVAWRRAAAAAAEHAGTETLSLLAEAIFGYIDELSAASADGFSAELAATAGEADRRRRVLLRLLLRSPAADAAAIEEAARAADWPLPATVAALAWRGPGDRPPPLPPGTLAAPLDAGWCAIVPDPHAPGRPAELRAAVRDHPAALGPSGPVGGAATSAERAFAALDLVDRGVVEGEGLVLCDDHLATLLLHRDAALLGDLADRTLAPLDDLREPVRERLAATLLAWLDAQADVPAAAARLHVHPQTVRYRMRRLRELFGEQLDSADGRFALLLALRGRAAPARLGAHPPHPGVVDVP